MSNVALRYVLLGRLDWIRHPRSGEVLTFEELTGCGLAYLLAGHFTAVQVVDAPSDTPTYQVASDVEAISLGNWLIRLLRERRTEAAAAASRN